jgi:hypothetical protein
MLTIKEIIAELQDNPTVSVPTAGMALAGLSRNRSYVAANLGTLGVPVFEVGGQKRVPSIAILQKLGLAQKPREDASAKGGQRQETTLEEQARLDKAALAERKRVTAEMDAANALLGRIARGELVLKASSLTPEMSD